MRFFGKTKIDFIGKRRIAFAVSSVIIIAGIVSLGIHKGPKYSIDFTGGVSLELDLTPVTESAKVIKAQEIRDALSNAGIEDAEIQEIKGTEGKKFVLIKTQVVGGEKDKTSTKIYWR